MTRGCGAKSVLGSRKAVFFDRDGTLMREVAYCRDPSLVETPPGLREGLAKLRRAGFLRVIITNQSGIGRGWISQEEYAAVQAELMRQLGGEIDACYMCPDLPDTPSIRRKPAPGMLIEAAEDLGINLAASSMVGDKAADLEAGFRAGVRGAFLVLTGYGRHEQGKCPAGTTICEDVLEVIKILLGEGDSSPCF